MIRKKALRLRTRLSNKKIAQATINSITTYKPRLLKISFNLLLIISYRFTINKLLQVLGYAFVDHSIS